jgi:hypothetical protein
VGVGLRITGERSVEIRIEISLPAFDRALVCDDEFDRRLDGRRIREQLLDGVHATGFVTVDAADDRDFGSAGAEGFDSHRQRLESRTARRGDRS